MAKPLRRFDSADGLSWFVEIRVPGSSNAMVVFRHGGGESPRKDRYAWYISHGPEARSVTSRLNERKVLESLSDEDLARLFRRSMPVVAMRSLINPSVGRGIPRPVGAQAAGEHSEPGTAEDGTG